MENSDSDDNEMPNAEYSESEGESEDEDNANLSEGKRRIISTSRGALRKLRRKCKPSAAGHSVTSTTIIDEIAEEELLIAEINDKISHCLLIEKHIFLPQKRNGWN